MIGPSLLSSLGTSALAQLACVTASLSYALAAVWARRFRRQGLSPLSVTTGQLTAGAAMMLPLALLVDKPWTHALPPASAWGAIVALALMCTAFGYVLYFRLIETSGATNALLVDTPWTHALPPASAWGAIVALALMCTAFGYVLYFRLIETSGATNALLVTLLVPPVAILLGATFLSETLAPQDFLGLGLIALGLAAIDGRVLKAFSSPQRLPREA
jgi:drug/metabolite transporter (DMT)-like permease